MFIKTYLLICWIVVSVNSADLKELFAIISLLKSIFTIFAKNWKRNGRLNFNLKNHQFFTRSNLLGDYIDQRD